MFTKAYSEVTTLKFETLKISDKKKTLNKKLYQRANFESNS